MCVLALTSDGLNPPLLLPPFTRCDPAGAWFRRWFLSAHSRDFLLAGAARTDWPVLLAASCSALPFHPDTWSSSSSSSSSSFSASATGAASAGPPSSAAAPPPLHAQLGQLFCEQQWSLLWCLLQHRRGRRLLQNVQHGPAGGGPTSSSAFGFQSPTHAGQHAHTPAGSVTPSGMGTFVSSSRSLPSPGSAGAGGRAKLDVVGSAHRSVRDSPGLPGLGQASGGAGRRDSAGGVDHHDRARRAHLISPGRQSLRVALQLGLDPFEGFDAETGMAELGIEDDDDEDDDLGGDASDAGEEEEGDALDTRDLATRRPMELKRTPDAWGSTRPGLGFQRMSVRPGLLVVIVFSPFFFFFSFAAELMEPFSVYWQSLLGVRQATSQLCLTRHPAVLAGLGLDLSAGLEAATDVSAASRCLEASLRYMAAVGYACAHLADPVAVAAAPLAVVASPAAAWWRSVWRLTQTTLAGWHHLMDWVPGQRLWSPTRLRNLIGMLKVQAEQRSVMLAPDGLAVHAKVAASLQTGLLSLLHGCVEQPRLRPLLFSALVVTDPAVAPDGMQANGHGNGNGNAPATATATVRDSRDTLAANVAALAWQHVLTAWPVISTPAAHTPPFRGVVALVEQAVALLCGFLAQPELAAAVLPLLPAIVAAPWPAPASTAAAVSGGGGVTRIPAISLVRFLLHAGLTVPGVVALRDCQALSLLTTALHDVLLFPYHPAAGDGWSLSDSLRASPFFHTAAATAYQYTSIAASSAGSTAGPAGAGSAGGVDHASPPVVGGSWSWTQTLRVVAHVSLLSQGLSLLASSGTVSAVMQHMRQLLCLPAPPVSSAAAGACGCGSPGAAGTAGASAAGGLDQVDSTEDWKQLMDEIQSPFTRSLSLQRDPAGLADARLRLLSLFHVVCDHTGTRRQTKRQER